MLFDAATEGRNVILSMLVVGLIFLGTILLFERPSGAKHPLLINQFGTERRMCMAFGVERLDDVGAKLANVLEMQPPEGLANKLRGLKQLKSLADSRPRVVKRAVSQEVVL